MKRGPICETSKAVACLCLLVAAAWLSAACTKNARAPVTESNMPAIKINIEGKDFTAVLADTQAAAEFSKCLPLTLQMNELNGNEKYAELPGKLPTASSCPRKINCGELMLYGNSTLVLFYESFPTPYSYTRIGRIDDVAGLKEKLGRGSVTVIIENK